MLEFLQKILGSVSASAQSAGRGALPRAGTRSISELATRLGMSEADLRNCPIQYTEFQVRKRSGGSRTIYSPAPALKAVQRRILRRLLRKLKAHLCATGFERGHSIVTNALPHVGQNVVLKLDLKDFFTSTRDSRVEAYFRAIGWDSDAAALLVRLCTYRGSLPQGAPTSPRLSNLVNHRLDARIAALAERRGASYSRYADDMTLSSSAAPPARINDLIHTIKQIVRDEGYTLHTDKKLRIARRHDRQIVTGIVVNQKPILPRGIRRRLRSVEHHLRVGKPSTLTPAQLAGWHALSQMVRMQGSGASAQPEVT